MISVEGMMSHSFKEFNHLCHQKNYERELETVTEKMKALSSNTQQQGQFWKELAEFYDMAALYLKFWSDVRVSIFFLVRVEVFTAVTTKNGVFWDVTPCGSCKKRRFGGTRRLLHQGDKNR
jgi:hypothetical protein